MSWPDVDDLHRTAKQFLDNGRAGTPAEAVAVLERFVFQVEVGAGIRDDPAAQAALATAINAGARAFLGGVVVRLRHDEELTEGWARGRRCSDMVALWGGHLTDDLDPRRPTLVIGEQRRESVGDLVMYAACHGWSGGITVEADAQGSGGIAASGVLAGALGVAEGFQHCMGDVEAGRRDVGVSLWNPRAHWLSDVATGPSLNYLPSALWLLGLGHLGQAYAWSLGFLPYGPTGGPSLYLVDTDRVVSGNLATSLLARPSDVGLLKTRLVSARLQELGFETRIVERRFDDSFRPATDEPRMALAGFDDPAPRRLLGANRFARVIDCGLGAGPVEFLDIMLHTFPSDLDPATAFADVRPPRHLSNTYEFEIARRVEMGVDAGDARCGVMEVAGITVGAAFVGAIAGALGVGDVLRFLHGGSEFSVLALDLRSPDYLQAAANRCPGQFQNLGYLTASSSCS